MTQSSPPKALQVPDLNQSGRRDDYAWLEIIGDPKTQDYLTAWQAYAKHYFDQHATQTNDIVEELKSRIHLADESAPWRYGEAYYFTKTHEDSEYDIFCRKTHLDQAQHEVLLDENALAKDHAFCDVGCYEISLDGKLLVYSVDFTGDEKYTIYIKNLETGAVTKTSLVDVCAEFAMTPDGQQLFYLTLNEQHRPYQCFRYSLTEQTSDILLQEDDEKFNLSVAVSKSQRFLWITAGSNDTTEIHYIDLCNEQTRYCFKPRQKQIEYYLEHHGDFFYLLSNEAAETFALHQQAIGQYAPEQQVTCIAGRPEVTLEDVESFQDFIVVTEREQGLNYFRILSHDGEIDQRLSHACPVYAIGSVDNHEINNTLRFSYESLHMPEQIIDYNLKTGQSTVIKTEAVKGGFSPDNYHCERLFAQAEDGTHIPISIVYDTRYHQSGNPLYLYGYGAYGATTDVWFSSNRLSLLQRGYAFAIAHIRGSGDCGKPWHDAGKLKHKINTFTDFIACADFLVEQGYTQADRLVISGGSAGGLLIGACLNLRPDLCGLAIADVPFVDVLNTMLNPNLPLTVGEYDEWGDPTLPDYYDLIASYSPYDNVQATHYPHIYVSTGLHDYRVSYWEPCKWVAKLIEMRKDKNEILLNIQSDAGHAGVSKRFDMLHEIAKEYVFILNHIKNPH